MTRRLKIIDRYVIFEMLAPFLMGVLGFVMIMVVDLLFTLTDLIINKGVPFLVVLKLMVYKLPAIMVLTFPVSTLFATSWVMGRMARDNEITVLRTSGINLARVSTAILVVALLISGLALFTNERIVPWANHVSDTIIRQIILKRPVADIQENVFFKDGEDRTFYLRRIDPKTKQVEGVVVYEVRGEEIPRTIVAKTASFDGTVCTLTDGIVHKYDATGRMTFEATFDRMRLTVPEDYLRFAEQQTPEEMNSRELFTRMKTLERSGVKVNALATDWHLKYAVPLVSFVFALLGIPLSLPSARGGKAWGVVLSIAVMFTFYVIISVFRSFGRGGWLPPAIAAWTPDVTFIIIGAVLLVREGYYK